MKNPMPQLIVDSGTETRIFTELKITITTIYGNNSTTTHRV